MNDKPSLDERTKTLASRVTPDFHNQVKSSAAEEGIPLEDFIRDAVIEKMKGQIRDAATERMKGQKRRTKK